MGETLHVGVYRIKAMLQNIGIRALKLRKIGVHEFLIVVRIKGFGIAPAQKTGACEKTPGLHTNQADTGIPGCLQLVAQIPHWR